MVEEKGLVVKDQQQIVEAAVSVEGALQRFKTFSEIKDKVLSEQDKLPIAGKPYINKSGWRKIRTIFNLSEEILESRREVDKDKKVRWIYKVRVSAKNGSFADAEMSCDTSERFAKDKPEAMIQAMAQTRAYNRAISDLVGGGEASFEEEVKEGGNGDEGPKPAEVKKPDAYYCAKCKKQVSDKVYGFSMEKFSESLCMPCQKQEGLPA